MLQPTLVCSARITSPALFSQNRSPFFFAAAGANVSTSKDVKRAVLVKTSRGILFTKAMVAKQTIDMNGNNIETDSFDSDDLYHSTYGKYNPGTAKDNGDVASNNTIVNSINIGNANIYGHIQTGPNGTASVGNQGGVGSHAWQAAHPGGIEPNGTEGQVWYSHDSNFTFPDTSLPYNSGLTPGGAADIVTTTFTINSNYQGSATTYPTPPPWSGVSTNVGTTTVATYPGSKPGLITNTTPTTAACPSYPAAGTYVGSVRTNVGGYQSDKALPASCYTGAVPHAGSPRWDYFPIVSYTYTNISSYTYTTYTYNFASYSTNTVYATNHYEHVLNSGDYYYNGSLSGSTIVLGSARLVLPSGMSMSGQDKFTIATGASVMVFAGGTSCSIGGNGVVNQSGKAFNFIMFCTPSVTSFSLNGNGEFTGVLIAPNANITMNGGGNADNDFQGALVVNSVTMNGHFKFHYDEALGRTPANGRLLITSWDEINPANVPGAN
jgi:hypothetical protein